VLLCPGIMFSCFVVPAPGVAARRGHVHHSTLRHLPSLYRTHPRSDGRSLGWTVAASRASPPERRSAICIEAISWARSLARTGPISVGYSLQTRQPVSGVSSSNRYTCGSYPRG